MSTDSSVQTPIDESNNIESMNTKEKAAKNNNENEKENLKVLKEKVTI